MHQLAHDVGAYVLTGAAAVVLALVGLYLEAHGRALEERVARRWRHRRRRCQVCGRVTRNAPLDRVRAGEDFGSTDRTGRFVCRTCHAVHGTSIQPRVRPMG